MMKWRRLAVVPRYARHVATLLLRLIGDVSNDVRHAETIKSAQMRDLNQLVPKMLFINILLALLVFPVLIWNGQTSFAVVWLCAVAAMVGLGAKSVWRRRQQPALNKPLSPRLRRHTVLHAAILGLVWILPAAILFRFGDNVAQTFIGCVIGGMMAAGAFALASVPAAAIAYLASLAVPAMIILLASGEPVLMLLAIVLFLYSATMLLIVHTVSARFVARVQVECDLQQQTEVVQLLLREFEESASDWLWEIDAQYTVRNVSPRFANAAGLDRQAMEGKPLLSLMDLTEHGTLASLLGLFDREQPFKDREIAVRIAGKRHWWSLTGNPLRDAKGAISGWRGVARDVTQIRLTGEELQRAKENAESANQAKSRFLATMSHELRTPLNAILGFSDLIRQQALGPVGEARYVEYADDIHDSGKHLLAIINDLLDLARIENKDETVDQEPVPLMPLLEAIERLSMPLILGRGQSLRFNNKLGDVEILADRRRIRQILINLVSNAIKFTPDAGAISVETSLTHAGDLRITVCDSGIGVSPQDQAKLFEPFQQVAQDDNRPFGGTGLGLYIARSMARAHGGDILFESTLGQGSRVSLILPAGRILCNGALPTAQSA